MVPRILSKCFVGTFIVELDAGRQESLPDELIQSLRLETENSIERLNDLLFPAACQFGQPVPCPESGLSALAIALRLLDWEARGITAHLSKGLQSGDAAFEEALLEAGVPSRQPGSIADPQVQAEVLALFVEKMAWSAYSDFTAQVELGEIDDETLVEALSQLIWNTRGTK